MIATEFKGEIRTTNQCPLCCTWRTQLGHRAKSEKCHERTTALLFVISPLFYP